MFGLHRHKITREEEQGQGQAVEQPILVDRYARYLGGHPMYPNGMDTIAVFWWDRLELRGKADKPAELTILYEDMTNVETLTEEHMKLGRVLVFGLYGALWKKDEPYTLIEYKDEIGRERGIAMEFNDIEQAQRFLYQRIVENRNVWKKQAQELKRQVQELKDQAK